MEPTIKDKNYYFSEEMNQGIVNGSTPSYAEVSTLWKKDLTLLEVCFENKNIIDRFIGNKLDKERKKQPNYKESYEKYENNRAIRAINRHLKYLKLYLGLIKAPEVKTDRFIYRSYYDSQINVADIKLTNKGTPNFKSMGCQKMPITKCTDEKLLLAKEYNAKREYWKKEKRRLRELIFKGEK